MSYLQKTSLTSALVLLIAALASSCASAPPIDNSGLRTMGTQRSVEFLTIGASDTVRVTVLGHPELSTSPEGMRVDPQGNLHLPMIGTVAVKGMRITQINELLHESFAKYLREPSLTAEVVKFQSRGFYAFGHLVEPGFKLMERPLNAIEALSLSGQLMRGADRENIFLLRPHDDRTEVHRFNMQTPGTAAMVVLEPGDLIYVRQTGLDNFQEDILPILTGLGYPAFQISVSGLAD
jgi:protein involved in polysaccharide export with SLBB domain